MSNEDSPAPQGEPGLTFLGRVLAGQCHELSNVLNVINELCGLQADLLLRASPEEPAAVARVADLLSHVQVQLQRGQTTVRNLGRLAHSVGAAGESFDAREVVDRAVFVATRQARLRQTTLEAALPADELTLEADSFRLQQAIHLGIELMLRGTGEGRRITVALTAVPDGARLDLESTAPVACDEVGVARLAAIDAVLQTMAGHMRVTSRRATIDHLVLLVPRRAAGRKEVTDAA